MSYTDGIFQIRSASVAEGAAAAVLVAWEGGTAGTTTFDEEFVFPGGATVMEFGVVVQVTLGTQATAAPVFELLLGTAAGSGASGTSEATITPAALAAAGTRHRSSSSNFPLNVPPGGCLVFKHKTAANPDTGDVFCYALVRLDGLNGANADAVIASLSS